ncbi:MAG: ATP-binding protein [Elusimicrobiota bacterium]|jgi:hypothetical protein
MIIRREDAAALRSYMRTFPVILVVGPRQSGKTTLVQSELPAWKYLDLEKATDFDLLTSDPEGFLSANPGKLIIDEAQRCPELFSILRGVVDRRRRPGTFVLTGSAMPALMKQAGETLAGRIGVLELTPFGISELTLKPRWLIQRWFWGGLPPLYTLNSARQKVAWIEQYVRTFLERDIPALGIRVHPVRLRKLWAMLAHVHGGLLNLSDLARSLDLTVASVSHYLDILEGAFMIRRLPPFHANISKRLVKSPKLYIRDSGLLHYLAGLRQPQDLETWPGRGQSWEGFVIEELIRRAKLRWPSPSFYFWRTQAGAEADLLIENGRTRVAVEIKSGSSLPAKSLLGIRQCMKDLGLRSGFVIYRGDRALRLAPGLSAIPWSQLERGGFPG